MADVRYFLDHEQLRRAVRLCFAADIPVAIWGPPGTGKSKLVAQLVDELNTDKDGAPRSEPERYRLYDFRLSDKEPSDLGGIPYPVEISEGEAKRRVVMYLPNQHLPFDTDERAIVFLDEFDRADIAVQNVALQLILDRAVNGHKLSRRSRVVLAGNGVTDQGTSPLTAAAANRMVHLYIETGTTGALESYMKYAEANDVSLMLRGFARFRQEVWANGKDKQGRPYSQQLEEIAYPTPRSFDYADRLLNAADKVSFKTRDIIRAVVAGAVGAGAETELMAYRDLYLQAPPIDEIVAHPDKAEIPDNPGILYALNVALCDEASKGKEQTAAVAEYMLREPEEPAAFAFRRLLEKSHYTPLAPAFQKWNDRRLKDGKDTASVERTGVREIVKALDGKMLPDSDEWVNRIQFASDSGNTYMISQRRKDNTAMSGKWACSCASWRTRRTCKHLDGIAPLTAKVTAVE